jgi:hypothetical protein
MLAEKQVLSLEELEAQTAIELPDRELMQVGQIGLVNVADVVTGNSICVACNVQVAASLCGVNVGVLATQLASGDARCTTSTGQQLLIQRASHR